MMEYEGIDAARLEAMEERLKKDVLSEARCYLAMLTGAGEHSGVITLLDHPWH
jgi:hypothetical protein